MISCRADLFKRLKPIKTNECRITFTHGVLPPMRDRPAGYMVQTIKGSAIEGNIDDQMRREIETSLAMLGFWRHDGGWRKDFNSDISWKYILNETCKYMNEMKGYSATWEDLENYVLCIVRNNP